MQTKYYSLNLLFLLGISVFVASCSDDDSSSTEGTPRSISELISSNGNYSILHEAVKATGLDATLNSTSSSLTFFAPDNDAFNRLFDALELEDSNENGSRLDEAIAELGDDEFSEIMLYHVLNGERRLADMPSKAYVNTRSTASPAGDAIPVLLERRGQRIVVNNGRTLGRADENTGGNVISTDQVATNGVMHGIDGVMLLPTVLDVAINNPNEFSGIVSLMVLGEQHEYLRSQPEVTLLIPTPAAFTAYNDTLIMLQFLGLSGTVALHHVLDFQVKTDEFFEGPFYTLNEQDIFIMFEDDNIMIMDGVGNLGSIVPRYNIQASNGIVHSVTRVLMPML